MKLYNTLTKSLQELKPLDDKAVRIYSCGPTVYDNAHIGNLSAYIFANTLRRTLQVAGYKVKHTMNYTDVDDKTIRRSQERYPNDSPRPALHKLTDQYIKLFLEDMHSIGNDTESMHFMRATDESTISGMKNLISQLYDKKYAYIADDGVYFSIEAYIKSGHTYGQLSKIDASRTSQARIQNDEYDKESVHDFVLWKKPKPGEPSWPFKLNGHDLTGRPGWHIECSVMSQQSLGQPFDIHTGGIDLIFPHHENEIAQSTALTDNPLMSQFFCHNNYILVDGKKMAKSAQNFYTLSDITDRGYDPLAFRLLVLQAHYRSPLNFTWPSLESAQKRLRDYQATADLQFQAVERDPWLHDDTRLASIKSSMIEDDLKTPAALQFLSALFDDAKTKLIATSETKLFKDQLKQIDALFGLNLSHRKDITAQQKQIIQDRHRQLEIARKTKDFTKSDELRDQLAKQSIAIRDTDYGQIWNRY